jgi:hypothetical protein
MAEIFSTIKPLSNLLGLGKPDGSFKLYSEQLSSVNFDGTIPKIQNKVNVSDLKPGQTILVSDPSYSSSSAYITKVESRDGFIDDDPEQPVKKYYVYHVSEFSMEQPFTYNATYGDSYSANAQLIVLRDDVEKFVLGSDGWALTNNGNAIFSNIFARGTIEATSGKIDGVLSVGEGQFGEPLVILGSNLFNDKPFQDVSEKHSGILLNSSNYLLSHPSVNNLEITKVESVNSSRDGYFYSATFTLPLGVGEENTLRVGDFIKLSGFNHANTISLNNTHQVTAVGTNTFTISVSYDINLPSPVAIDVSITSFALIKTYTLNSMTLSSVPATTESSIIKIYFDEAELFTTGSEINLVSFLGNLSLLNGRFIVSGGGEGYCSITTNRVPAATYTSSLGYVALISTVQKFKVGDAFNYLSFSSQTGSLQLSGTITAHSGNFINHVYVGKAATRFNVTRKKLLNNVVTLRTSAPHGFFIGDEVIVSDVDPNLNGTYSIASTPSEFSFTYGKTYADIAEVDLLEPGTVESTIVASGTVKVGVGESGISIDGTNVPDTSAIYAGEGNYGQPDTGFWMDATGRFSLKDKLIFDTSGNLTISGTINASAGNFTNTVIVGGSTSGTLQVGSGTNKIKIVGTGSDSTTYINTGSTTATTGNGFYFGADGKVRIASSTSSLTFDGTDLSVTGAINAASGTIGGWGINSTELYSGSGLSRFYLNSSNGVMAIGTGNHGSIDTGLYVDKTGKFSLSNQLIFTPSTGAGVQNVLTTGTFTTTSPKTITVASSTGIKNGMTVTGEGIDVGTTITNVVGSTITISKDVLSNKTDVALSIILDDMSELQVSGRIRGVVESSNPVTSPRLSTTIKSVVVSGTYPNQVATIETSGHAFVQNEKIFIESLPITNGLNNLNREFVVSSVTDSTIFIISLSGVTGVTSSNNSSLSAFATLRELTMGLFPAEGINGTDSWYHSPGTGIRLDKFNWWLTNNQFRVGTSGSYFKWDGSSFNIQGSGTKTLRMSVGITDSDNYFSIVNTGYSPTYNNPNTPFFVNAQGKFSLGEDLLWDGTNLIINGSGTFSGSLSAATGTFSGSINAGSGTIASWQINDNYLSGTNFSIYSPKSNYIYNLIENPTFLAANATGSSFVGYTSPHTVTFVSEGLFGTKYFLANVLTSASGNNEILSYEIPGNADGGSNILAVQCTLTGSPTSSGRTVTLTASGPGVVSVSSTPVTLSNLTNYNYTAIAYVTLTSATAKLPKITLSTDSYVQNTTNFRVRNLMVEYGSSLSEYFDGTYPGANWIGVPFASISRKNDLFLFSSSDPSKRFSSAMKVDSSGQIIINPPITPQGFDIFKDSQITLGSNHRPEQPISNVTVTAGSNIVTGFISSITSAYKPQVYAGYLITEQGYLGYFAPGTVIKEVVSKTNDIGPQVTLILSTPAIASATNVTLYAKAPLIAVGGITNSLRIPEPQDGELYIENPKTAGYYPAKFSVYNDGTVLLRNIASTASAISITSSLDVTNKPGIRSVVRGQLDISTSTNGAVGTWTANGSLPRYLINIYSGGNVFSGGIYTSGGTSDSTITYYTFSGTHYSQLPPLSEYDNLYPGTIIESTGDLVNGGSYHRVNQYLPKSKISDTYASKSVYGVYYSDHKISSESESDGIGVTGVGALYIRINKDVEVSCGDLIMSNGDGTGTVQPDDIIKSCTVGKVTSAEKIRSYEDGSYIVPAVLYCG